MTIRVEAITASETSGPAVVECKLCGTRLRRNDEPDPLEVGADSLLTIARHRCAPRVTTRPRVPIDAPASN